MYCFVKNITIFHFLQNSIKNEYVPVGPSRANHIFKG